MSRGATIRSGGRAGPRPSWHRLALVATIALASCTGRAGPSQPAAQPTGASSSTPAAARTHSGHVIATASGDRVDVFESPGTAQMRTSLTNPTPDGANLVFLVSDPQPAPGWLKVHLPVRPNGSTGFVRRSEVDLASTSFRVEVRVSRREVAVWDGGSLVLRESTAVGSPQTPTPTGTFYITDLLRPHDPAGIYGPYAFGLSGHSAVLDSFGEGDGNLGLHGTNVASSIGQAVTHGCLRLPNATIERLAGLLPLGTPVLVTA